MITDLVSFLKVSCHTKFRFAEREAQCILSECGPLNISLTDCLTFLNFPWCFFSIYFLMFTTVGVIFLHVCQSLQISILKDNTDLQAGPVCDITNSSYQEKRLPASLKDADIVPVPKQKPIIDVN